MATLEVPWATLLELEPSGAAATRKKKAAGGARDRTLRARMQHAPNPRVGKRPAPWSSRDIGSFDRLEQIGEGMYGCERARTFVLTTIRCFL